MAPRVEPSIASTAGASRQAGRADPLARLATLASQDRYALYELTMHCRDRGHPIAPHARPILARLELLQADGEVSEAVRALVRDQVRGHGLLVHLKGHGSASSGVAELVARGDLDAATQSLIAQAKAMARSGGRFDAGEMARWAASAATLVDQEHGQVTPALQALIGQVETLLPTFSAKAKPIFYDLVAEAGGKLAGPVPFPTRRVPYWQKDLHPLANFQSRPSLPKQADVVIIGAGLTGASAAYHLRRAAEKQGLKVVILDAGDPAGQASGRNGGNFELIPENFFGAYGTYDGYQAERLKFLEQAYPDAPRAALERHARKIADTVIRFALKNAERMKKTIERERIDCDFSPAGWLRTSYNEREVAGTVADAELAARHGASMELLDEAAIAKRYGFPAEHGGRLIRNNGNYHPFKFVCGEIQAAIDHGVELYTRTPVEKVISKRGDQHLVKTKRGTITAKRVIVATNAFTARLFPELAAVRPFRSQVSTYRHVEDRLDGISVTAKDGDIYGNHPGQDRYTDRAGVRRGTLNVGNDVDTEIPSPFDVQPSAEVFKNGRPEIDRHFSAIRGQPAIRAWAGPMAFVEGKTGMRMPLLGPLGEGPRAGVFVAIWCNGYGGTGCHNAGAGAASWALTGKVPKDMPQDVFGVGRLWTDRPTFPTGD